MRGPVLLALLVTLAWPATAQLQPVDPSNQGATPQTEAPIRDPGAPQQAPGVPSGDPSVQSAAPETGAGRGEPNAQQPQTSEPQQPTGGARPEPQATAPRAPTPTIEIPAGPPLSARAPGGANELELEHALRGGVIGGRVTIPNQSAGILIQPQGRDWRQFRMRILTIAGAVALVGTVVALGVFFALRGKTRIAAGRSGRRIARYTLFERANHWMVAVSFITLALTGLNITYGAYLLRPIIGAEAFTTLTLWGQASHHYVAFAFMVGIVAMFVHWARENIPRKVDVDWLRAGGPLAKGHPPAGKFNAGQKALYWLTMGGGIVISVSGILLMLPGLLDNVVSQQWAHIVHGVLAMGMIAMIMGHIYIGSIGMEGALEGMRDGEVDYNWAREHHSAWLDDELAQAKRTIASDQSLTARAAGAD